MAFTIAFIASIYLTGAIILVSEICSKNIWFEDEEGMLYLVFTQQ